MKLQKCGIVPFRIIMRGKGIVGVRVFQGTNPDALLPHQFAIQLHNMVINLSLNHD